MAVITGDSSSETLQGSTGADTIFGNGGVDRFQPLAGDDLCHGGDQPDFFENSPGLDTAFGGGGDDRFLFFTAYSPVLDSETWFGGTGNDLLWVNLIIDQDIVIDARPDSEGFGAASFGVRFQSVELFDISLWSGDDFVYTGDGADRIFAALGNDTLYGGGGHDILTGSYGDDRLFGGGGDDIIDGDQGGTSAGNDGAYGGAGDDQIGGGGGGDSLWGDAGDDFLTGGDGDDALFGGEEDDALLGDAGDDTLAGGVGDDTLDGGQGSDTADYAGTAAVRIDLSRTDPQDTGGAGFNRLIGIETVIGSSAADRLDGNADANAFLGGSGNDRLDGRGGDDTLEGGLGNDTYFVDSTGDVVQGEVAFASGGGIDTVLTSVDFTAPTNLELVRAQAGAGNLTLTGNDAPGTLVGNEGNNTLNGRGGNDQINGNAGNDTLIGGEGADTLVGGAGADRFVFSSVSNSRAAAAARDVLNGFERGAVQDRIDLAAIDANTLTAGINDAFAFIGTAVFSAVGQLRLVGTGATAVIVAGDVNGDGVADLQIFVNLQTVMVAGDFVL